METFTTWTKGFLKFKAYFQNYSLWDLGVTILITFGTILLGYLLANITRLVTNLFENKITPFVYYLTAPGKIVMKSELDDLQKDFDDLERRYDAVRVEKSRLANEVEELLKRNSERKITPHS